ncbi:MAG: DNA replication/repair protein RecF [Gammaproteobacteria bacterium CG_4_10_14_0_8_um_filter_38_16]|nr:MAG: DNA replication/repair protein RecF [Gammaproteobacteria bacterium CG_4_10_14_0_8_um_filter_38_16]PJA03244.1 MAG: DNA replication/repair protein RecF [Gammaproteobacteria bacterium CG_4_10_14_0_2_um_filter_38_22]PJB10884.1 MAG: DNA replication/repair protein RecF [Gammaproteobacteria bacterium CG_4_9_14_3_um_filter_38_9]
MSIVTLQISNLRNITSASIECSKHFNLFFGDNGAGKTSILEAVHCLSMGKSFRTSSQEHIIHHGENAFALFINFLHNNAKIPIGIQRSRDGNTKIRINEESLSSATAISSYLPVQFIGSASHRILTDGPKSRRQFLDWGLFYTQPAFFQAWKSFQKCLHHKNAALKAHAPQDEIAVWNNELAITGTALHEMREQYIQQFLPFFKDIMSVLLKEVDIQLSYSAGWDSKTSLISALSKNMFREYHLGYTLHGPHRADLIVSVDNLPAQEVLSQGQQKLVAYALRLSQGLHFQSLTSRSPIYLIDDLPSELDATKRSLVTNILSTIEAQVFITGIKSTDLEQILMLNHTNRMFHVKHGVISNYLSEKCFT